MRNLLGKIAVLVKEPLEADWAQVARRRFNEIYISYSHVLRGIQGRYNELKNDEWKNNVNINVTHNMEIEIFKELQRDIQLAFDNLNSRRLNVHHARQWIFPSYVGLERPTEGQIVRAGTLLQNSQLTQPEMAAYLEQAMSISKDLAESIVRGFFN